MYCKKCGKELQDDFKTCPYCGTPVDGKSEEQEKQDEHDTRVGCAVLAIGGVALILLDRALDLGAINIVWLVAAIVALILLSRKLYKYVVASEKDGTITRTPKFIILSAVVVALGITVVVLGFDTGFRLHRGIINEASTATTEQDTKDHSEHDGWMDAKTYWCNDYDTLITLSDAMQRKDNEAIASLAMSGKIHFVDKKTHVTVIDTGLLDKNAVSVIFLEGKYVDRDGYTFKDWTTWNHDKK